MKLQIIIDLAHHSFALNTGPEVYYALERSGLFMGGNREEYVKQIEDSPVVVDADGEKIGEIKIKDK